MKNIKAWKKAINKEGIACIGVNAAGVKYVGYKLNPAIYYANIAYQYYIPGASPSYIDKYWDKTTEKGINYDDKNR